MATPLDPTIDYTSRDYEAIRADMIRLIKTRLPQWSDDSDSDFGLAMVEAFAYSVDIVNYYLDRVANEAYLDTAVQRESLYSIAKMFNYIPKPAINSVVDLEFSNTTGNEVLVPKGTRCQASITGVDGVILKNFETSVEVVLPAVGLTMEPQVRKISASEGRTYRDEELGISNGFVSQKFTLPITSVLPYTVSITTQLGDVTTKWEEYRDLSEAGPDAFAFQVFRQTDESTVIQFGDGLNGEIPELHAIVRATFRVGGGSNGNVPAHSINNIVEPGPSDELGGRDSSVLYGVTVTNPFSAKGGTDTETLNSVRLNAARSFRSRDRAVTLIDFVSVAETAPGMAKAKAVGNNGSSVTVYVSPADDGTGQPLLSEDSRLYMIDYLEARAMAGVTVSVFGPNWVEVFIKMTVHAANTAYQATVESAVRERMAETFSFLNVDFGGRVAVSDIAGSLTGIPGVEYIEITDLSQASDFPDPPSTATILMDAIAPSAIQYFNSASSLSVSMVGGIES